MNEMKINAEIRSATRLTAVASFDRLRPKGGVSHHAASFVLTPSHSHRIRDVCRWPTACTTIVTAWKKSQLCQQLPQLCYALIVLCAFAFRETHRQIDCKALCSSPLQIPSVSSLTKSTRSINSCYPFDSRVASLAYRGHRTDWSKRNPNRYSAGQ